MGVTLWIKLEKKGPAPHTSMEEYIKYILCSYVDPTGNYTPR